MHNQIMYPTDSFENIFLAICCIHLNHFQKRFLNIQIYEQLYTYIHIYLYKHIYPCFCGSSKNIPPSFGLTEVDFHSLVNTWTLPWKTSRLRYACCYRPSRKKHEGKWWIPHLIENEIQSESPVGIGPKAHKTSTLPKKVKVVWFWFVAHDVNNTSAYRLTYILVRFCVALSWFEILQVL